jgi:hypothetical protein
MRRFHLFINKIEIFAMNRSKVIPTETLNHKTKVYTCKYKNKPNAKRMFNLLEKIKQKKVLFVVILLYILRKNKIKSEQQYEIIVNIIS